MSSFFIIFFSLPLPCHRCEPCRPSAPWAVAACATQDAPGEERASAADTSARGAAMGSGRRRAPPTHHLHAHHLFPASFLFFTLPLNPPSLGLILLWCRREAAAISTQATNFSLKLGLVTIDLDGLLIYLAIGWFCFNASKSNGRAPTSPIHLPIRWASAIAISESAGEPSNEAAVLLLHCKTCVVFWHSIYVKIYRINVTT